jgi:hypothetical protein
MEVVKSRFVQFRVALKKNANLTLLAYSLLCRSDSLRPS